jgi:hypothetical protein
MTARTKLAAFVGSLVVAAVAVTVILHFASKPAHASPGWSLGQMQSDIRGQGFLPYKGDRLNSTPAKSNTNRVIHRLGCSSAQTQTFVRSSGRHHEGPAIVAAVLVDCASDRVASIFESRLVSTYLPSVYWTPLSGGGSLLAGELLYQETELGRIQAGSGAPATVSVWRRSTHCVVLMETGQEPLTSPLSVVRLTRDVAVTEKSA